eukprot:TRINITY_DN1505_c0_g2_i3.p1 TRINITY_DN1505_c0_g2~~TRINITY_DN1505_c0_g2_i3.p1  ORF type:complete len:657 (+),score=51.59 TRINITY_DN1505_c0_g2_i3:94-2064(+)
MLSQLNTLGQSDRSQGSLFPEEEPSFAEELTRRIVKVDDATWKEIRRQQLEEKAGGKSVFGLPVMSAVNPFAVFWSGVSFLLDASYTALLLPFFIAFLNYGDERRWEDIVDFVAGALFTVDLFLNFHIAYYIKYKGQSMEIYDGKLVARFYMRNGQFTVDAIMVLSFLFQVLIYVLASGHVATILNWCMLFLRLLRLVRVWKVVQVAYLNSITQSRTMVDPTLLHFLNLLYITSVIVNSVGCLWYFVSSRVIKYQYTMDETPETWIIPFLGVSDTISKEALLDEIHVNIGHLYVGSIYYTLTTVTTVGYGDISPQNDVERVCAMFIFFVGIIFFSFLIGSVTELLASATKVQRRAQKLGEKLTSLQEWMSKRKLPRKIRQKLNRYYGEIYAEKQEDKEEEFLSEIPFILRAEVAYCLTKQVMENVKLFTNIDEEHLQQFASRFKPLFVAEGEVIYMEGDQADALYILDDGVVEISYKMNKYGTLTAPAVFGEQCLLIKEEASLGQYLSTVSSVRQSRLWRLDLTDIEKLMQLSPELERQFRDGIDEVILQKMATLPQGVRNEVKKTLQKMKKEETIQDHEFPIDAALLAMIRYLRMEQQIDSLPSQYPVVEFQDMQQSYVGVNLSEAEMQERSLQTPKLLMRNTKKVGSKENIDQR